MDDESSNDSDTSSFESDEDFSDNSDSIIPSRSSGSSAKVITENSLLAAQEDSLHTVMELLDLKEHHARSVLIHSRWNVEMVYSKLAEEEGIKALLKEAGISINEDGAANHQNPSTSEITCGVCMDLVSISSTSTMDCGHCFCNECWSEHFILHIREGKSKSIRCMEYKCGTICDESIVRSLIGAKSLSLMNFFDRSLLESYIDDNEMVKWCPSAPHCGNAIRVDGNEICEVECSCGLQFCFSCLSGVHSPCSCLMWDLWSAKCQNKSVNTECTDEHIKPCPKCQRPVQKIDGCNQMLCICNQSFCWICGAHTPTHVKVHRCYQYKAECHEEMDDQRYLHYYNRYKAQLDSFDLENKLGEDIMSRQDYPDWLPIGFCSLTRGRQVIANSYVFAYYMFGDMYKLREEEKKIKRNHFENQQQQIEAIVEKLSMFMNKPFDELCKTQPEILSLSLDLDFVCQNLYEFIENGLLKFLPDGPVRIAPYRSNGIEKASEFPGNASSGSNSRQLLPTKLHLRQYDSLI